MTAADIIHNVFVSIGSNIDRHLHVSNALDALQERYTLKAISSVYESIAIGFIGDPFFNLVVQLQCTESLTLLSSSLRKIEEQNGRRRGQVKFSDRKLDIDILLYDECVGDFDGIWLPRAEITENAYVLWPLAEIAGELKLPGSDCCAGNLWSAYDRNEQQLLPVPFTWQGNVLPLPGCIDRCHLDASTLCECKGSPDE